VDGAAGALGAPEGLAQGGRYVETAARFRSYVMDGGFVDPHDSLALDEEVAR
jgi:hypothetical protein